MSGKKSHKDEYNISSSQKKFVGNARESRGRVCSEWLSEPEEQGCAQARRALIESEERYRNLVENSLDGILLTAPEGEGKVLAANPQASKILGWPEEELIGSPRAVTFNMDDPSIKKMIEERVRTGHYRGEVTFKRKDGTIFSAEVSTTLFKDSAGNSRAVLAIRDITERKRIEEELHRVHNELERRVQERTTELEESRKRYRDLAELLPEMVFEADTMGRFTYANRQALETFGYTTEEFEKGIYHCDMVAPRERARVLKNGVRILRGERREGDEYVGLKKDGTEFPIFIRATLIEKQGKPAGFRGVVKDLTESRKAEEEFRRLAIAVEAVAEGVGIFATDGTILYVNPGYLRMTGYEKRELVGRNVNVFRNDYHSDRFYHSILQTVLSGETWAGRVAITRKDGSFFENDITISPVRDSSGVVMNYAVVARDVTEKLRLEEQLRQAQKMEALGTLAGGIAHDFNNILAAIIGFAELLQDRARKDTEEQRSLQSIVDAGLRGRDLVRQMLTFSRKVKQERKPLQLADIIRETTGLLRASIPSTIDIRLEAENEGGYVMGDAVQLQQVLMNLCTNAAHAMQERGGILTIGLKHVRVDRGEWLDSELNSGRYMKLSVTDTGHGMTKHIAERIFDPFFTTKKTGEGTGLGLSVVHGIVKSHNGAITVESRPGKGSIFNVYFPLFQAVPPEQGEIREEVPRGRANVLLIDDEESLIKVGRNMLERLGYSVTASRSSAQALSLFASNPRAFDVVITDQTMPDLTGLDLATRFIALRPDIPIVLVTGFSHLVDSEKAKAAGIKAFLMKPVTRGEMARTVSEVLER
ncbi:MAG: Blue-light-activated protein [Syntrophorhabdaceae bacterium PtaU1.Bin034]|nr:MAG: Blue-light-activated protein [Syntrophorhabdaceae bacterium PtaU1.Bin034]